jgi:hypothetical protein
MNDQPDRPTFRLLLRFVPGAGGDAPLVKLRRFLKWTLRVWGLKAVEIVEMPAVGAEQTGKTEGPVDA